MDGSAISANLGVNPSLTITAQAERAAGMWPNRGDEDPRPALGAAYRPVPPVPPGRPAVPPGTAAALRLPLVTIRSDTAPRAITCWGEPARAATPGPIAAASTALMSGRVIHQPDAARWGE